MTPIHKINLSAKLVLLFLLTGVAIIILFGISAGSGFKKHFQDSLNPHLYQYFNYINSEIGSPPDLKKAQQLSESLNIKILLKGTHINWSSDDSLSDFSEHLLAPHFDKNEQYF